MLQKRKAVFFLTVLVAVVMLTFSLISVACTSASDPEDTTDDRIVEKDGLRYKKTDEGTYEVTRYSSEVETATILSEVNGIAVTKIATQAFYECYNLKNVVIPEGITEIGTSAFYSCVGLAEVVIPDSVTTIGNSAFQKCDSLLRVTFGESLQSIGSSAFSGCFRLVEIVNKSSIQLTKGSDKNGSAAYWARNIIDDVTDTKIASEGDYIIYDDSMILAYTGSASSLTIAEGITEIGYYAFSGHTSLESVILPESIEKIDNSAFRWTGLTSIIFPANLNYIGAFAFGGCSNLASATFENINGWYSKTSSGEQPLPASLWPTDEYIARQWLADDVTTIEYIRK